MKRLHSYQRGSGPWVTVPANLSSASIWRFIRMGQWTALAWDIAGVLEIETRDEVDWSA